MSIRSKVAFGGVVCVIAAALSAPCMAATPGDYDGDGKADVAVFPALERDLVHRSQPHPELSNRYAVGDSRGHSRARRL